MMDDKQLKENLFDNMSKLDKQIKKLRNDLDVGVLNANKQIKEIISLMNSIRKMKKDVVFSSEENTKFEEEFNRLKKEFKRLKSIHIEKYNEKIVMLNRRFKPLSQKLIDRNLSDEIKTEIKLVPHLIKTDVMTNNRDWRHHTYLDKLDYDKMEFAELMISQLEIRLNIKNTDNTDEIQAIVDEVSEVLKTMEQKVNSGLNSEDIEKGLFECGTLLGRLLALTTEHEKLRDKISKERFSYFSSNIVDLQNRLNSVRDELLNKRSVLSEESIYNNIKNQLEILDDDYNELTQIIIENEHKCNETMIVDYQRFLSKFKVRLDKIAVDAQLNLKEGKINQQQYNNLNDKIVLVASMHDGLKKKISNEPVIKSKNNYSDNFFKGIETELKKLKKEIADLGTGVIKDRKVRKKYESMINELSNSLDGFKTMLLSYDKTDSENYKQLKNKYDEYKKEFDELNNSYSSKCPLVVKKIREAKPIYKKHKKLSLISAGLASVALVNSSYTIVPAIMHGNSMLGTVPGFKGMMNFFNKILGGLIGASVSKNGTWVLATGAVLNGTVAITSILKFLATIGVGTAVFTAPLYIPQIILLVKQLIEKIKAYDLKQKIVNTYENGVKKVKEVAKNVEQKLDEYDLTNYYNELYATYMYNSKKMTLDEFCEKNKLTEGDKKVLSLMISRGNIEEEFKKIVGQQASNKKRKTRLA